MNLSPRSTAAAAAWPLAACLLVACLLVAAVAAQDNGRPDPTPTTPERNGFLEGWMTELLEGDVALAREKYRQVLSGPTRPGFQTELSLLRLRETSFARDERNQLAERLEQLGVETFVLAPYSRLAELQKKFEQALKAGDQEAVVTLREEVRKLVQTDARSYNPRSTVAQGIMNLRTGRAERTDPEIEEMRQRVREARAREDHRTAWRLAWEIRSKQRANSGNTQATRRLLARRRIEMTRLHLLGEHARAAGMEKSLRSGGGRSTRRRSRYSAEVLLENIRAWSPAERKTRFEEVQERLQRKLQPTSAPTTRPGLLAEERTVLEQVRERFKLHAAAQEWEKGLTLAAHTPYRAELFRRSTR